MESILQVFDVERVTARALEEAVRAFDAVSGAIYIRQDRQPAISHTLGEWNANDARASVPITCDGKDGNPAGIGTIQLGARKDGSAYSAHDLEILENNAGILARAIVLARRV